MIKIISYSIAVIVTVVLATIMYPIAAMFYIIGKIGYSIGWIGKNVGAKANSIIKYLWRDLADSSFVVKKSERD